MTSISLLEKGLTPLFLRWPGFLRRSRPGDVKVRWPWPMDKCVWVPSLDSTRDPNVCGDDSQCCCFFFHVLDRDLCTCMFLSNQHIQAKKTQARHLSKQCPGWMVYLGSCWVDFSFISYSDSSLFSLSSLGSLLIVKFKEFVCVFRREQFEGN